MKKKLLALVLSLIFLMPTAVFAQGNSSKSKSNGNAVKEEMDTTKEQAQTKVQEKKANMEEFKAKVKERNQIMKENNQELKQLKSEIQTKRQQLESLLDQVQDGTIILSDQDLEILTTQVDALKGNAEKIKECTNLDETKDEIQDNYDCEDFESANTGINNLLEKQEERYNHLVDLSDNLDSILSIF